MERSRCRSWSESVEGSWSAGLDRAMDSSWEQATTSIAVEEPGEGGHDLRRRPRGYYHKTEYP